MTFQIYFRYYSTRAIRFANRSRRSIGGPRGIRTLDLLNAIETRSQLRYGPLFDFRFFTPALVCGASVSDLRFGLCSGNRKSKIVIRKSVDLRGFEPLASSVRLRRAPNCATGPWLRRRTFYCTQ